MGLIAERGGQAVVYREVTLVWLGGGGRGQWKENDQGEQVEGGLALNFARKLRRVWEMAKSPLDFTSGEREGEGFRGRTELNLNPFIFLKFNFPLHRVFHKRTLIRPIVCTQAITLVKYADTPL